MNCLPYKHKSMTYNERFAGIKRLYGINEADKIRQAHVCIIGIGGVGSWAAEALVRSGIGRITLIDHDDIAASNINRQIHSTSATLNQSKVTVMADRIADINPECECHAIDDFVSDSNLQNYLLRDYDFVIDAIDSIRFKAAIIYFCKRNKIPVITTGGAGGLIDPTKIEITDLAKTWNDPLAAKVRSRLRSEYGYTRNTQRNFGVLCVFSTEQQRYPKADGSVCTSKPGVKGVKLDCNLGFGSSSCVTASFGFAAAARVLQKIVAANSPKAQEATQIAPDELTNPNPGNL